MKHDQFVGPDTCGCLGSPLIIGELNFIGIRRQVLYHSANLTLNQAMLRKIFGQRNNIK
jgi:hypothetical protein